MTTLQALITKLGSAEEGSRDIDCQLHIATTGEEVTQAASPKEIWLAEGLKDGPSWMHEVPYYTSSLDASLPGENIISVQLFENGKWQAIHANNGAVAYAKTEILARRLACLKAMADD